MFENKRLKTESFVEEKEVDLNRVLELLKASRESEGNG